MATAREVRFRVLYVAVGILLTSITISVFAAASSPWWAVIPGALCAGWWWAGLTAGVARLLGFDTVGDEFRSRPHEQ